MRIIETAKYANANDTQQCIAHWMSLPAPDGEIPITPKPHDHWGTSLDEDTIRITGSPQFIDSILARLKDLLKIQSDDVTIDVQYVPTAYEHAGSNATPNFVFRFSAKYNNPTAKIPRGPVRVPNPPTL